MLQQNIWLMTLVAMGFITAIYLFVFIRASQPADAGQVKARLYGIRPWWFLLLVAIAIVAAAVTLGRMPYADTHGRAAAAPAITVEATAHQWYWLLSRREVPAGREVAFKVTAQDVNHSFALYDEKDRLVVQTQAMPGYTNIVRHTFAEPGSYRILCLEYCGVGHHAMMTDFTVVPAQDQQGGE